MRARVATIAPTAYISGVLEASAAVVAAVLCTARRRRTNTRSSLTRSVRLTCIVDRTFITVAANVQCVDCVLASIDRVAAVVRTGIVVVAVERSFADADAVARTHFSAVTDVGVGARRARLLGKVVAGASDTKRLLAHLRRAVFRIRTRGAIGDSHVDATDIRQAKVIRARIQVITVERHRARHASSVRPAHVSEGADITVVTRKTRTRQLDASVFRLADVLSTFVGRRRTHERTSVDALSVQAVVLSQTDISFSVADEKVGDGLIRDRSIQARRHITLIRI